MAFDIGHLLEVNHGPPRTTVVDKTDDKVGDGMAPGDDDLALRPSFARCLLVNDGNQERANIATHYVP